MQRARKDHADGTLVWERADPSVVEYADDVGILEQSMATTLRYAL